MLTLAYRARHKPQTKYLHPGQPARTMINKLGCHTGDYTGSAPGTAAPWANMGNVCLVYQSIYSGRLSPWNPDSRLREDCLHPLRGTGRTRWIYFSIRFLSQPNSAPTPGKDLVGWSIMVASDSLTPKSKTSTEWQIFGNQAYGGIHHLSPCQAHAWH